MKCHTEPSSLSKPIWKEWQAPLPVRRDVLGCGLLGSELWMQAVRKSGQLQENPRSTGKRLSPGRAPNKSCWGKINISAGCHSEILLLSWYFPAKLGNWATEASCNSTGYLWLEKTESVQEEKKKKKKISMKIPQILIKNKKAPSTWLGKLL